MTSGQRKTVGGLTGALLLYLVGQVVTLSQRVTALETAQRYLHGTFEVPKVEKP